MQALQDPRIFLPLLITVVLIANFLSYFIYRYVNRKCRGQAKIQTWSIANGKATYLIAGNLNQPHTAFKFALGDLIADGVTTVKYRNTGFNPYQISRQIVDHIRMYQYTDVTIYAISVGDQVARWVKLWLGDNVRTIAINPCSEPKFLKPHVFFFAYLAAVVTQIACNLLGFLSLIPCIPACGNWYSLQLLTDQLDFIVSGGGPTCGTEVVPPDGMQLSRKDEFLKNDTILQTYPGVPYVLMLGAKHGNTVKQADLYRDGLKALWQRMEKS